MASPSPQRSKRSGRPQCPQAPCMPRWTVLPIVAWCGRFLARPPQSAVAVPNDTSASPKTVWLVFAKQKIRWVVYGVTFPHRDGVRFGPVFTRPANGGPDLRDRPLRSRTDVLAALLDKIVTGQDFRNQLSTELAERLTPDAAKSLQDDIPLLAGGSLHLVHRHTVPDAGALRSDSPS